MSTETTISDALHTHLRALTGTMPIAWPNVNFGPSGAYLRPNVLRGDPMQIGLGSGGESRYTGIYQVDVFFPEGKGGDAVLQKADDVANHFRLETRLSKDDLLVRVTRPPTISPAIQEPGWFRVAVSVPYQCDVNNGALP